MARSRPRGGGFGVPRQRALAGGGVMPPGGYYGFNGGTVQGMYGSNPSGYAQSQSAPTPVPSSAPGPQGSYGNDITSPGGYNGHPFGRQPAAASNPPSVIPSTPQGYGSSPPNSGFNGKYGGAGDLGEKMYGGYGGSRGSAKAAGNAPGSFSTGLGNTPAPSVQIPTPSSPPQSSGPPPGWPADLPWPKSGTALVGALASGGIIPSSPQGASFGNQAAYSAAQLANAISTAQQALGAGRQSMGLPSQFYPYTPPQPQQPQQAGSSAQPQQAGSSAQPSQAGSYAQPQQAGSYTQPSITAEMSQQQAADQQMAQQAQAQQAQQAQQLSGYAQPNYSVNNGGAAAAGGYAKGGTVKGFDSGGSLDDAPSIGEGDANQGNQPAPMPALPVGNTPSAPPSQGVIPSSPAVAAAPAPAAAGPQPGAAVDPQALQAYLSGAGAMPPAQAAVLEQQVDPNGQMPEKARRMLAIANAPPGQRFALMQHHRQRYNALSSVARVRADQGDMHASTHAANRAVAHVPYMRHLHFSPASAGVRMHYSPIGGGRAHYMLAIAGRNTRIDQGLLAKGKEAYGRSKPQKAHAAGGLVKSFAGGGLESVMNIAAQPQRDMSELAQAPQPQTDPSEIQQAPQPGGRAIPQAQQPGRANWELAQAPQQGGRAIAQAPQPQRDLSQLQMAGKGPRPENMGLVESINSFADGGGVPNTDEGAPYGAAQDIGDPELGGTIDLSVPQYHQLLSKGYDWMAEHAAALNPQNIAAHLPGTPGTPGTPGGAIPQQSSATKPASQGSSTTTDDSGSTAASGALPGSHAQPLSAGLQSTMPGQLGPFGSKNPGEVGSNPDLLSPTPADEQQGSSKNMIPTPLTAAERASDQPADVSVMPSNPSGADIQKFNASNGGRAGRAAANQQQWVRTSPNEWQSLTPQQLNTLATNRALANPKTAPAMLRGNGITSRYEADAAARTAASRANEIMRIHSDAVKQMLAANPQLKLSDPATAKRINNIVAARAGMTPAQLQQYSMAPQINQNLMQQGTSAASASRQTFHGFQYERGSDGYYYKVPNSQ